MRRAVVGTLAAVALTALVGCGQNPSNAPASSTGATSTPSATARPSITEDQAATLLAAATFDAKSVANLGQAEPAQSTPAQPDPLCGLSREPRNVLAGYSTRVAFDENTVAIQLVAVYQHPDASAVMANTRSDSHTCYPANVGSGTLDNHSEFAVPTYPGAAEEFGYCDRYTRTSDKSVAYICHALQSHGNGTSSSMCPRRARRWMVRRTRSFSYPQSPPTCWPSCPRS